MVKLAYLYKASLVVRGVSKKNVRISMKRTVQLQDLVVRALLSVATTENMTQCEVSTAFLNRTVEETIYMKKSKYMIPLSLLTKQESTYGWKQVPCCWNDKFVKCNSKYVYLSASKFVIGCRQFPTPIIR